MTEDHTLADLTEYGRLAIKEKILNSVFASMAAILFATVPPEMRGAMWEDVRAAVTADTSKLGFNDALDLSNLVDEVIQEIREKVGS